MGFPVVSKQRLSHAVFGGSRSAMQTHSLHHVEVTGHTGGRSLTFELLTHIKICHTLPRIPRGHWWDELIRRNILLSDVGHGPEEIELLLGADACPQLLKGQIQRINESLIAVETELGWTLLGRSEDQGHDSRLATMVVSSCLSSTEVEKLWRLDTIGITDPITSSSQEEDELRAMQSFLRTVTRRSDGRYQVALPWNHGPQPIPSNKSVAFKRLESATKKLKDHSKYHDYNLLFKDWLSEGLIEVTELEETDCHFLPHRPVYKPDSLTTPVRPVFDASCKTGRHPSLNDCLHKGPNEMNLIPAILHRFRIDKIGVVADIRKAYQMIDVNEEDRRFLKFLWWTETGELMAFRHCRVVFGVNCSAFLLSAVLDHLLQQCNESDKQIATKILTCLYVDNLVTSVSSYEELQVFKDRAVSLLAEAKMDLRQWEWTAGDSSRVGLPTKGLRGLGLGSVGSHDGRSQESTVLGIQWDKGVDVLFCSVPDVQGTECKTVSKRRMLSAIAQLFDPMGWCAPALLIPKVLLQSAWILKKGWDEELKPEEAKHFIEWASKLKYLTEVRVPRYVFQGSCSNKNVQLHSFGDASKSAYAAVVFLRVEDRSSGLVNVQLLQAKSKVAPTKNPTIPRLELLSCLITVRLTKGIVAALKLEDAKQFFWTDSAVALAWIRRNDNWGTFVGNRVKEINTHSSVSDWNHIPGEFNPADLPSRGCSPEELAQSRWWEGPKWLKKGIESWPSRVAVVDEDTVQSEKKKVAVTLLTSSPNQPPWFMSKYSNYNTNLRVFCWVRRFIQRCQRRQTSSTIITQEELDEGERSLFSLVQKESFELGASVIEGVKVTVDGDGLYRVHTKLIQREDTTAFKAPVILPSAHPFIAQLVRHEHITHGHCGVQSLMCRLREKVWIVRIRKTIKSILSKCVICRRFNSKPLTVPVAPLPEIRVGDSKAFEVTGVDLAGPVYLKNGTKVWICLFTCAVYRCVHLDVVESLSTENFILCLQRFVCRRGRPRIICSDNGTNFVGANNIFLNLDWTWTKIEEFSATIRIQWRFNPPSAAWWGGWWERLIKSIKDILKRMLGKAKLNLMQFVSVLCEVESEMNRRPLTYVSEDPDDLLPLTPEMFLLDLSSSSFPVSFVYVRFSLLG